jgi:hypothetical protein
MTRDLFDARIRSHALRDEVARVRRAHPRGYLAVQFSADFGDDATLALIASQLKAFDIVLFRAGAAPWHDDIDVYARMAARHRNVILFSSLNIWDICALIACSAGYSGSSLHGRIVAMAYALPRVNLLHPESAARPAKQNAYAATWDDSVAVSIDDLADALRHAARTDPQARERQAAAHAEMVRAGFASIIDVISRAW